MKSKLAQLVSSINQIDRRYVQMAGLFIMLAVALISQSPSDGGVGPI